jgi:hypothetical protein
MLRVLAVSLDMWLAYRWKIKELSLTKNPQSERKVPSWFYGVLLLVFILAFWLEYLPVYWLTNEGIIFYADQNPGDRLPLHAFLAGALAGYILADQTLSDERLAEQASQGGQAHLSKEASTHGLLRTAIANAGVAVLILAALIAPSSLLHAVSRLQNFEAAGVKLSFGGNTASNLAEAIRTASPPRSQWTGNTPSAQGGFVPIRLETIR